MLRSRGRNRCAMPGCGRREPRLPTPILDGYSRNGEGSQKLDLCDFTRNRAVRWQSPGRQGESDDRFTMQYIELGADTFTPGAPEATCVINHSYLHRGLQQGVHQRHKMDSREWASSRNDEHKWEAETNGGPTDGQNTSLLKQTT